MFEATLILGPGEAGFWLDAARITGLLLLMYSLAIWIAAVVWTYRDIRARTDDRMLQVGAVALVAVFTIPGLILYMILRPQETAADAYARALEEQALLQELQQVDACPSCRRSVHQDFVACPYCKASLRSGCERCGRSLAQAWVMCPYCGADRPAAAARATPQPAAGTRQPAGGYPQAVGAKS